MNVLLDQSKSANLFPHVPVRLGGEVWQVPVLEVVGQSPGKTVAITGGFDGDEYAGMVAAYQLGKELTSARIRGRVIIVPIVNIPGFEHGLSQNPLDGKFPKHVYPGKADSSPTDELVDWASQMAIKRADLWIDLHGGALTEQLTPFAQGFVSGNAQVDAISDFLLRSSGASVQVFQKNHYYKKVERLASRSCPYLMLEAGQLGRRDRRSINLHLRWVQAILSAFGVLIVKQKRTLNSGEAVRYQQLTEYSATTDAIWKPYKSAGQLVLPGDEIGLWQSTGKTMSTIIGGQILWQKIAGPISKGEIVCAIGH